MKPRAFLAILLWVLAALGFAAEVVAGPYRIELATDPAVVPVGKATLRIMVRDSSGKPVTGAAVKAFAQMPGMPMGELEQQATPSDTPGLYTAPAQFSMAGGYDARISISGPAGSGVATIPLSTGEDSSGGSHGGFPWVPVGLGALAIVAVAWVVARMRRMGMPINLRGLASWGAVGPLILVGIVLAAVVWAVNTLRRPGSMTPLAAQGMEMATPAPPGSAPVTLATVQRGIVQSSVRYTGQAAGYVEQDIYPRVTGTLTYMPLYVGDRVRKGQVIARLDVSQLAPQVAEQRAMVDVAQQGVGSASADYQAALAMVEQAQAEHGQYHAAIGEAEADLAAAKENKTAMEAQVASAQADVQDAQARETAAQADADYWKQELARMEQLLKQGAVSRDEYQQAQASANKANAGVEQMRQGVRSAQAKVHAAQASARQADAEIAGARRKLAQAQSEMKVHLAHVASAKAGAASARQKISQATSGVRQAQAGLASSAASEGYATIASPIDGVVTLRNVTQGTLVQPGASIVRIAQTSPIRLQANVPTADLAKVRVGAQVTVYPQGSDKGVAARVTSISPTVDAVARTGTVEALIPNKDGQFLPGQYLSMDISIGSGGESVSVPNEAVQSGPDASGTFVWVAEPGGAGQFTVRRVNVRTGDSDGKVTAILSGLNEGLRVVTSGFINLSEGASVTAAAEPVAKAEGVTIHITEAGFEPASVTIPAGAPAKITFMRMTENTCAKEVVFPTLGIKRNLPLNQAVTIDLGTPPKQPLTFACGMDMLKGELVVR